MRVKIITLAYDNGLRGFSQETLERLGSDGAVLEVRDHFFVHQGVPHLALVVLMDEAVAEPRRGHKPEGPDPGEALPEALQPLYRNLRRWRNERAKAEGVPAYALFRNTQLAEICRRLPRSLSALREIEGVGEATSVNQIFRLASTVAKHQGNKLSNPSCPVSCLIGTETPGASAASKP